MDGIGGNLEGPDILPRFRRDVHRLGDAVARSLVVFGVEERVVRLYGMEVCQMWYITVRRGWSPVGAEMVRWCRK